MNILGRITIKGKLNILVAIMLGFILLVGVLGFRSIRSMDQALHSVYEEDLRTIENLSNARAQSRANYANLLHLMVVTDSDSQKEVVADIEAKKAEIEENFKIYEGTELDEKEQQEYEAMKGNSEVWDKVLTEIIELATTGKEEEAARLFQDSGQAAFENLQDDIINMVNYSIESADATYTENDKTVAAFIAQLVAVIITAVVLGVIFAFTILRSITGPINKVVGLIKKTSDLDFEYNDSYGLLLKQKGEIGTIVQSVENLRNVLRETLEKMSAVSNNLAASSEEMTAVTDENKKSINQIVTAIGEIATGNNNQAETAIKVSETISGITSKINDADYSTSMNVDHALKSLKVIEDGQDAVNITNDKIVESVAIVSRVSNSVQELTLQMEKVSNITQVINSIATQTNLLALNAAIEAARAGEAGKGFSVVAEEIRTLAEGSTSAVKEISEIITAAVVKNTEAAQNMEQAMENGDEQVKAIKTTLDSFDLIKTSVNQIVKQTEETAGMLKAIAGSAKEISNQTQDMASVAEESAAGSEEISASSEQQLTSIELIARAAGDLSGLAMELNDEINKFKL